ncbi:VanZ family protein [Winogradskyella algicola]|uniref:VanZ family protein n=1 Tax=Winogradskyella algicola TaxID=2575815 RepID=UPI0011098B1F|nr:VanZ family protein [Winogradskyella algicola]
MLRKLLLSVAVIYTLALIIATFINLNGVPSLGSSFDDKIYHFIAYAGLAGLWTTYFKPSHKKQTLWFVFVVVILFGVLLELMQHQLNQNRTYDTYDLLANCLGVVVGTLIAARLDIIKLK